MFFHKLNSLSTFLNYLKRLGNQICVPKDFQSWVLLFSPLVL